MIYIFLHFLLAIRPANKFCTVDLVSMILYCTTLANIYPLHAQIKKSTYLLDDLIEDTFKLHHKESTNQFVVV
jgi:hypothetical protein